MHKSTHTIKFTGNLIGYKRVLSKQKKGFNGPDIALLFCV
jgi:hypothetical protein